MQGAAIVAADLTLDGPEGPVVRGVSVDAAPGALVAVAGPGGSGRTSVLLALAGRMRPAAGRVSVGGRALPGEAAAVRALVGVARIGGAVELEDAWRVDEALALRGLLRGSAVGPGEAQAALERAGVAPPPEARIGDLHPRDRTLLELALATLEAPAALVLDDADRGLDRAAEEEVWAALRRVAATGTTVVASTADAAPAIAPDARADHVVRL